MGNSWGDTRYCPYNCGPHNTESVCVWNVPTVENGYLEGYTCELTEKGKVFVGLMLGLGLGLPALIGLLVGVGCLICWRHNYIKCVRQELGSNECGVRYNCVFTEKCKSKCVLV
ncbi:Oidioi.mRNA.OKI2018_I69.PAR.g10294.t1.cds [Oikopleura dioica]|uniref:Oidioi.mRNA.OKI2018_I69.PAR.g10294.t1.cds n=1 Tax=Oikopleura dioica TaxID=34765 RepID=A0ABN7RQ81_OIKDI|nr:Oidioi.mRNA.OKI2018_I69.PAR.g10294.t1.cds [Oikopleura dioica]